MFLQILHVFAGDGPSTRSFPNSIRVCLGVLTPSPGFLCSPSSTTSDIVFFMAGSWWWASSCSPLLLGRSFWVFLNVVFRLSHLGLALPSPAAGRSPLSFLLLRPLTRPAGIRNAAASSRSFLRDNLQNDRGSPFGDSVLSERRFLEPPS